MPEKIIKKPSDFMKYLLIACSVFVLSLMSCEEKNPPLAIPQNYDPSTFQSATSQQEATLTALINLTSEIKKGRTGGKVSAAVAGPLLASLKSNTTTYYYPLTERWLQESIDVSGGATFDPGNAGGVYGGYLFTKFGLENEQLIEKGMFNATLFNSAKALGANAATPEDADKILMLFGAHPDFANSNNTSKHTHADRFMANYIARRDKNDGNGLYTSIKANFIKLQAALKAGDAYKLEKEEALKNLFENWEKGSAATAINYMFAVLSKLSSTSLEEASIGSALHSYSEAIGFLHGMKTIEGKIITDAQLDEILMLLNAPATGNPTTLNYLSNPVQELAKMQQALEKLQQIYRFTSEEMKDFEKNWVSEQGR